jgi:hypothetical protein
VWNAASKRKHATPSSDKLRSRSDRFKLLMTFIHESTSDLERQAVERLERCRMKFSVSESIEQLRADPKSIVGHSMSLSLRSEASGESVRQSGRVAMGTQRASEILTALAFGQHQLLQGV